MDSYEQTIQLLYGRINYERAASDSYSASDFKLDRMRRLLQLLGDPQEQIPAVHIAGTKGKGSTSVMVAEMLAAAGYRTGLYTSPHITQFEERMKVNGAMPSRDELVELVNLVRPSVEEMDRGPDPLPPTYFEIATALAWLFFVRQRAELAILEVGLGGRLDSTNVCRPLVCVITNISRDHTHLLGNTLRQIATEKAGIIKPGVPVVSGISNPEALAAVQEICEERGAPLRLLGREIQFRHNLETPEFPPPMFAGSVDVRTLWRDWRNIPLTLPGSHQAANAALAVAAIDELNQQGWPVSESAVFAGMQGVRWPARIEVLRRQPTVIVDAAHNWESIAALLRTLDEQFPARRRILIFSTTRDKDAAGMLRQLLPRFETVILTRYLSNPRAVPCEELLRLTQRISDEPVHVASDPAAAWHLAQRLAGEQDLICVTGSFFLAAELRGRILAEP